MENQQVSQTALKILLDKSSPLIEKFRAVFTLRNIGGPFSIDGIFTCLRSESSELLKHECAYCLGQIKDPYAIDGLINLLKDENQEVIVRHEAAEALAAIGIDNGKVIKTLQIYMGHSSKEVRETCYLALKRFTWLKMVTMGNDPDKGIDEKHASYAYDGSVISYDTIDPTPPLETSEGESLFEKAGKILLDEGADLYYRYRALFSLRDLGTDQACRTMALVLQSDSGCPKVESSPCALLKHEVAFVLGQIQNSVPLAALEARLQDSQEHPMVRHECAEAIGSITGALTSLSTTSGAVDVDHYQNLLKQYLNDPVPIVRESCAVALDIADYVSDNQQFQFVQKCP